MASTFGDPISCQAITAAGVITAQAGITATGTTITAQTFVGAFTGVVTGSLVGNVIGGAALKVDSTMTQNLSADGAISILNGVVYITKAGIAAITIANPTVGTDDFKVIFIYSETAFAHVITQGTQGFDLKGASGTLTFTAAKGSSCAIMARNGFWEVLYTKGVTVA